MTISSCVESGVTAQLTELTLVVLGQTDPPTSAEAFAGEVAHFRLWDRPLPRKELKVLASCAQASLDF